MKDVIVECSRDGQVVLSVPLVRQPGSRLEPSVERLNLIDQAKISLAAAGLGKAPFGGFTFRLLN